MGRQSIKHCARSSFVKGPTWLLLAAAFILGASGSNSQFRPVEKPKAEQQPTAPPDFSVGVNLVRLLATVHDASGRVVTNLNKEDFAVRDTSIEQAIAVFERNTSLPLSVSVLIDTSGSTQIELHSEIESVIRFLHALLNGGNPEDMFSLYSFSGATRLEVDFSRNRGRAEHALHALRCEGGTSLYDAIYLASDALASREGRHVMVVVTDGGDTTSYKRFTDAARAAQRADIVLYPIVVIPVANEAGRNLGGEHALTTLSAATGGRNFSPGSFEQLDLAFADILRELRTQYLIGFYPKNATGSKGTYHPVTLEMHDASMKITVRNGYYEP